METSENMQALTFPPLQCAGGLFFGGNSEEIMTSASNSSYSGIELRKLPPSFKIRIGQLLDIQDSWKILMCSIPSEKSADLAKYSAEHLLLIENHGRHARKSCGEILLDEWSTSGRIRPTTETLLDLLTKCELYRAADFVATEILGSAPPERPSAGPAAKVPSPTEANFEVCTKSTILVDDTDAGDHAQILEQLNNQDLDSGNLVNFSAAALESSTKNFDAVLKVGSGAFGEVFKVDLSSAGGPLLAVKALHPSPSLSLAEDQFLTEIRVLSTYRHDNLLQLIGFSSSGPRFCLVYKFMPGGSLLKALACDDPSSKVLPWTRRLSILHGVALGINYLHNGKDKPLVHRDIKSANVLLDHDLTPKLGDFGLAKSLSGSGTTSALTSTIIGTSAYMAPEAFRGDISPKMDIFSFGVIVLEVITGLPPYDEEREGNDLVTFIQDNLDDDEIDKVIDKRMGDINVDQVNAVYQLSEKCLEDKKRRLTSDRVVQELDCVLAR